MSNKLLIYMLKMKCDRNCATAKKKYCALKVFPIMSINVPTRNQRDNKRTE